MRVSEKYIHFFFTLFSSFNFFCFSPSLSPSLFPPFFSFRYLYGRFAYAVRTLLFQCIANTQYTWTHTQTKMLIRMCSQYSYICVALWVRFMLGVFMFLIIPKLWIVRVSDALKYSTPAMYVWSFVCVRTQMVGGSMEGTHWIDKSRMRTAS